MNKAVEDALAVIERVASRNFIITYSEVRNAHATLAAHIAAQDAEIESRYTRAQVAEHVRVLDELRNDVNPEGFDSYSLKIANALDAAIAALSAPKAEAGGQGEAVAEVTMHGMVGARFYENCNYGCNLKPGTKLYTHPPASVAVTEAMEGAAEEIERGHEWITSVGASAIIRKHAAALLQGGQND